MKTHAKVDHGLHTPPIRVQASVVGVCLDQDQPLVGIALQGPSNIGKSSLALALIETCPWQRTALVSDDMTDIVMCDSANSAVIANSVEPIKGLIEIRGFGPAKTKSCESVNIELALSLTQQTQTRVLDLQFWQFENAIERQTSEGGKEKIVTNVAHIPYCVEKLTWYDHAIRTRAILRSVFAGQTP